MNIGKYEIIRHLGEGISGNVFEVKDKLLQDKPNLALKLVNVPNPQEFVDRIQEARLMDRCQHKNIVQMYDANIYSFNHKSYLGILEELLDSSSQDLIDSGTFCSVHKACFIIRDALLGLEYAHNQGVYHRDIKPGNILIRNKVAKISDFGFAVSPNLIITGGMYRTHASPELLSCNSINDLNASVLKSSDIYAMGVTFYRLLNNHTSDDFWKSANSGKLSLEEKIQKGKFPNRSMSAYAPHIPAKIRRIANISMHLDVTKRYSNCHLFRQALEKLKYWIDWSKTNDEEWCGYSKNDKYDICLNKGRFRWKVNFFKNGRRMTKICNTYDDREEAIQYFYETISSTTVR